MKPQTDQKKVDKKLQQFLDELNELQETYQYVLKPVLNITNAGVVPTLSIQNRVPAKKKAKPKKK